MIKKNFVGKFQDIECSIDFGFCKIKYFFDLKYIQNSKIIMCFLDSIKYEILKKLSDDKCNLIDWSIE